MTKIYIATKQELNDVSDDVTTINQQLNTAVTGIEPRLNAVEGLEPRVTQVENDLDAFELQLNDPTTGIVKQLVDIDTEINETGTGIKARLDDLEQGGTTTTKFRTHIPSGVYEDGEVIQRLGLIYKANGAIDGSVTPVPFVVGVGANTWTLLGKPAGAVGGDIWDSKLGFDRALVSNNQGDVVVSNTPAEKLEFLNGVTDDIQTQLEDRVEVGYPSTPLIPSMAFVTPSGKVDYTTVTQPDFLTKMSRIPTTTIDNTRVIVSNVSGQFTSSAIATSELGALDGITGNIQNQLDDKVNIGYLSPPPTGRAAFIEVDNTIRYSNTVSSTELGYLDGVTSKIQDQLNLRPAKSYGTTNPTVESVAIIGTDGNINYATSVSLTELGLLDGVTSSIQTQLDNKATKGFTTNPDTTARVATVGTNGVFSFSGITTTELGYLDGVTSKIQTQLNARPTIPSHSEFTQVGSGGVRLKTTESNIYFNTQGTDKCYISGGGSFRAISNASDLGSSDQRWGEVFLTSNPNVSSDRDLKEDIRDIPEALTDVWFDYVTPCQYVMKEGNDKSKQIGVIAQDVIAAFDAAGLDWHEYGVVFENQDFIDEHYTGEDAANFDYYSVNYAAVQLIEAVAIRRKLGISKKVL